MRAKGWDRSTAISSAVVIGLTLGACGGHAASPLAPPPKDGKRTSARRAPHRVKARTPNPPASVRQTPVEVAAAALSTLKQYEIAFDRRDVGGLQNLLAPSVHVYGFPDGCSAASGRTSVLSSYEAFLAFHPSTLVLTGVDIRALTMGAGTASTQVGYRLGQKVSGTLRFDLVRQRSLWAISLIASACHATASPSATAASAAPPATIVTAPVRQQGHAVVHPRPGCTVVLAPSDQPSTRLHRRRVPVAEPSQGALVKLCAAEHH